MKLLYSNTKKPEPKCCHWRNKPEEIAKGLAAAASEAGTLVLEGEQGHAVCCRCILTHAYVLFWCDLLMSWNTVSLEENRWLFRRDCHFSRPLRLSLCSTPHWEKQDGEDTQLRAGKWWRCVENREGKSKKTCECQDSFRIGWVGLMSPGFVGTARWGFRGCEFWGILGAHLAMLPWKLDVSLGMFLE